MLFGKEVGKLRWAAMPGVGKRVPAPIFSKSTKANYMAQLTKTISQFKKSGNQRESFLSITVDYDPKNNEVEGIESVEVYNFDKQVRTDITAIMAEQFSIQLDEMINAIDWRQEYAEEMAERRLSA